MDNYKFAEKFTDAWKTNLPIEATEKTLNAEWGGGKPGQYFRCALCGYKFVLGDVVWPIYTNDIAGASGNPFVCNSCYTTRDEVVKKWKNKWAKWRQIHEEEEWWWFRGRCS